MPSFLEGLFTGLGTGLTEERKRQPSKLDLLQLQMKHQQILEEKNARAAQEKRLQEASDRARAESTILDAPIDEPTRLAIKSFTGNDPGPISNRLANLHYGNIGGLKALDGDADVPVYDRLGNVIFTKKKGGQVLDTSLPQGIADNLSNAYSASDSLDAFEGFMKNPEILKTAAVPGSIGARSLDSERENLVSLLALMRSGKAVTDKEYIRLKAQVPTVLDYIEFKATGSRIAIDNKIMKFRKSMNRIIEFNSSGRHVPGRQVTRTVEPLERYDIPAGYIRVKYSDGKTDWVDPDSDVPQGTVRIE